MQVIQHVDPTGLLIVARVPPEGSMAIQLGSQLVVEESQEAVFFRDGKALDTFGPGRHTLKTANLPLLTRLVGLPFEGKSPFQAAVVFVSKKTFFDLKWGTKEAVAYRDRELGLVRLRAFGKFAVRVADVRKLVVEIVGTQNLFATDAIEAYLRDIIVSRLARSSTPSSSSQGSTRNSPASSASASRPISSATVSSSKTSTSAPSPRRRTSRR